MNSHRFQKLKEIYTTVLAVSQDERDSFLRELCGDDPELRGELESLLTYDVTHDSFIDLPPDTLAAELLSESDAADLSGQEIGHYKIISRIGRGGMGSVYLATDERLERTVAVKSMDTHFCGSQDQPERFLQEAKAASSLNHPNILTVHDIVEFDGRCFIATEFIEGETLSCRINDGPLEIEFILDAATQVASALEAAHGAGIVHRDIKPDNIMIRPDGLIKVVDFGIAKISQPSAKSGSENGSDGWRDTRPGTIIGTTSYMSPEHIRGCGVAAESDIFSFGVVLYEMLTGTLPYRGETPSDVMAAILTLDPVPVQEFRKAIPAELIDIVNKTLKKDPRERYEHGGVLYADLKKAKKKREIGLEVERSQDPALVYDTENGERSNSATGDSHISITRDERKTTYDAYGRKFKTFSLLDLCWYRSLSSVTHSIRIRTMVRSHRSPSCPSQMTAIMRTSNICQMA